jgi:ankyrin repeat protein
MKRSELLEAIRRGDLAAVKALVAVGAPLDWNRWRGRIWRFEQAPLQAAIGARSVAIVECLLDHRADPNGGNPRYGSPLAAACIRGDLPIVELLVRRGAHIDGTPGPIASPIGVAATTKNMELVEWLLAYGANPSTAFAKHVPIHLASQPILARLLDAGAEAPPDIARAVRAGKW